MTNHHDLTSISIAAAGLDRAPVLALEGEEEIGRTPRFAVTFAANRDLDAAVGARACLVVGDRTIGGVIADIESGEALYGDPIYRATLVPRAWLLSQGRQSRVFERLTAPEIIEAVVVASGLDVRVQTHLRDAYPARLATVQHRESDLDFITRLAERDGIALCFEDDGERATISLSDHNDALPDAGHLTNFAGVRRKTRLLPRRIELVSADPVRPELPLHATEIVAEAGRGDLQIHDIPFSTPEEGARAARLHAEWLRSTATVVHGQTSLPIPAGSRVRIADRAVLVASARHTFSPDGVWSTQFTAIPEGTLYRPERRAAAPRVFGLMGGRLSPRGPGQTHLHDGEGRYRVREAAGAAERIMPMAGGGALERELGEGTQVVWGCIEGDPERPVITAVLPDSASPGRAVLRGPGGSIFEVGGAPIPGLGEVEGLLDRSGVVPAVAHHSTTTEDNSTTTGTTDTWMRFAVPHTDKSWSYLRIGEAATSTSVSATSGETFSESADKCLSLEMNSYDADGLAGVFDFTDKNRTVLTKGDWEQVVSGSGRLAINDNYELKVTSDLATIKANTSKYSWTDGTEMTGFSGFKMDNVIGGSVSTMLGGSFDASLGFMSSATIGYKLDAVFADSYEYRHGEDLSDCSTIDSRAWNKIQFSIAKKPSFLQLGPETPIALVATAAMTGFLASGSDPTKWGHNKIAGTYAAGLITALALARVLSKEKDLDDGNPILSLDSNKSISALRSDDWLLMMSPCWAVLGKNKSYDDEVEVAKLSHTDLGAGISIVEQNVTTPPPPILTIQAGNATAGSWARILLEKQAITVFGDTITISGAASGGKTKLKIDGEVEITGNLKVGGTLEVTGASTFTGDMAGPGNFSAKN